VTSRVSISATGAQARGASRAVAVSRDGRFVAFVSDAANLVPGDTNGITDVFVRDRLLGTTERVSVDSNGRQAQRDPEFGMTHDRQTIASVTGVPLEDLDPALPIQTVSTGTPFTMLPIRNLEAMGRLQLKQRESSEYLKKSDGRFFFCVTRETVDSSARIHARMLFYNGEDPATGSASGCCAAWMVQHGIARPEERVMIEQGVEMMRPSRIFVRASRNNDRVVNVRVGGNVVEVLRGELFF